MGQDHGVGPEDLRGGPADSTAAALSAIVDDVSARLEPLPWDSPPLLFEVGLVPSGDLPEPVRSRLDELDDVELIGPAWTLSTPVPLQGHPFDALVGRRAGQDSVGVVLATEAWMTPTPHLGDGPLSEDLAAHRGDDGRTEVRNVCLVLRDGSAAQAVAVRGGAVHHVDAAVGRIPAALRRTLGAPCGLDVGQPAGVVERAWMHSALSAAEAVGAEGSGGEVGGMSPADATLAAAAGSEELLAALLPPAFRWLLQRVRRDPQVGWGRLLAEMAGDPDHGVVAWLLRAGSSTGWSHGPCDEEVTTAAIDWCDAPMFGYLFDAVVPDLAAIAETFERAATTAGFTVDFEGLCRAAAGVSRRGTDTG